MDIEIDGYQYKQEIGCTMLRFTSVTKLKLLTNIIKFYFIEV